MYVDASSLDKGENYEYFDIEDTKQEKDKKKQEKEEERGIGFYAGNVISFLIGVGIGLAIIYMPIPTYLKGFFL